MTDEIEREIERYVAIGLAALSRDDDAAADEAFRHAVHLCADAAAVAREILRQGANRLSR